MNNQHGGYRIAVVGATGAVGTVILDLLQICSLPIREVVPFASARSVGQHFGDGLVVQELSETTITGFDLALFSAGGNISERWASLFIDQGTVVIDNSSRFRQDPQVPLVVSEVNPEALYAHQGLIANPNCSTMQLMVALKPIHDAVGIERIVVSTYQSTSGTGVGAVQELRAQTQADLDNQPLPDPKIYPHPIAFNVLGAAGNFIDGDDYSDEERKMIFETGKILDPSIRVSATCARVPVMWSHSISVNIQTQQSLSASLARELLLRAPGITVLDDPSRHVYPTARQAHGRDDVLVGRIRMDASHERALNMWIVADNLRKGAATNAVQIAEQLHNRRVLNTFSFPLGRPRPFGRI